MPRCSQVRRYYVVQFGNVFAAVVLIGPLHFFVHNGLRTVSALLAHARPERRVDRSRDRRFGPRDCQVVAGIFSGLSTNGNVTGKRDRKPIVQKRSDQNERKHSDTNDSDGQHASVQSLWQHFPSILCRSIFFRQLLCTLCVQAAHAPLALSRSG